MMTAYCAQTSGCVLRGLTCLLYDFQTLVTGLIAVGVAIVAALPVWRQLRDTNLQTRISHRETLADLLRSALRRYQRVDEAIADPLRRAQDATSDPVGEVTPIDAEAAFHLESVFSHILDWYLVVLAGTEHAEIEEGKRTLKSALDALVATLGTAHWADHNDQRDEDRDLTDDEWAKVLADCARAKVDASARVGDVQRAYRALAAAQKAWVRSLRTRIARLDLTIAAAGE
jgi:hypothetical protein